MIANLTQHVATPAQIADGATDVATKTLGRLLTFSTLPSRDDIEHRAAQIADLAENSGFNRAMIGGAPFLMPALERALRERGIAPCYAFSLRESVDETMPDGSVRKVAIFKHAGFVPA